VAKSRRTSEPFSDAEHAAWHGLLQVHAQVAHALDEALTREHRMPVSSFDVLITLANAPDRKLRMSELADAIMFSPSGLTRLVARLERGGLVAREPDPDDGRSSFARATPEGIRRLDAARATHDAVIREQFLDHLSAAELRSIGSTLSRFEPDQ
jgi:DNA-binding MarR family transcriptional regulator